MNKICTSIEQSQKLIEFGIDVNTADMYWWYSGRRYYVESMDDDDFNRESDVPAWSLSTLLELIPTSIDEHTEDFSQLEITKYSVSYVYATDNLRRGYLKDNLLDVAFEMVCWLLKNKKI